MRTRRSRAARWSCLALVVVSGLLTFGVANAQSVAPRIVIERPAELPVRVASAKVSVEITGSVAVTTIDLSLHNPNARVLEGSLEFPLRDGQRVIGFASEVNDALREAVAIEKAKGRQVFDDVERSQIDPALLEKTAGDNYRLRVYPIRANGQTRLQITLIESLAESAGGLEFRLPLGFASDLKRLELALRVADPGAAPTLTTRGLGVVALQPAGRYYALAVERQKIGKEAQLTLRLPETGSPRVVTQTDGVGRYFYAELPMKAVVTDRPAPKRLAVVWDASGSATNRRREDELNLLRGYLEKLGEVEVSLHVLRDAAEPPQVFSIRNGDSAMLRAAIAKLPLDGATNLAALPAGDADAMLLFSDGLHNFGETSLIRGKLPLLVVNSALQSDATRLRRLAAQRGGAYVDLSEGFSPAALTALLTSAPAIADLDARGLAEVTVAPIGASDTRVRVAGRITGTEASLRLRLVGVSPARVNLEPADFGAAPASPHAAHLWAQLRFDELAAEGELRRGERLRLAKAHALVTEETSLLVLERIEDYLHHEIMPPVALRDEYERLLRAVQRDRGDARALQVASLVAAWEARKSWWAKPFPKDQPKPPVPEKSTAGSGAGLPGRMLGYASAPPAEESAAPPPPPPPPAVAAMAPAPRGAGAPDDRDSARGSAHREAMAPESSAEPGSDTAAGIAVRVRRWTSDAPYLRRFAAASPADLYAVYLDERPAHLDSPAFFIEAADRLAEAGQPALALRVLSNLAEMQFENRDLLRVLAGRLVQMRQAKLAVPILRRVLLIAPDEPQSLRDLALALAEAGSVQEAADRYVELLEKAWDPRFGDIAEIALAELNALRVRNPQITTPGLDHRLAANLPTGLRVVLSWDVDNTDVDLWVVDPNGEKVYYSHRESYQGGRLSQDVTRSYGPEEFILRQPKPGKYRILADFFGHNQQVISSGTTIEARVTTGFGTPQERTERALLRLAERKENALVAEIEVR